MLGRAVAYLYSRQGDDQWEQAPIRRQAGDPSLTTQWGGLTSLAVYALLSAGENPQNPRLAQAIGFLKQADIRGIYALGLRAQVWTLLPDEPATRQAAMRDGRLIFTSTKKGPQNKGFYDYLPGPGPRYDHSASQYGVLGMWAAAQAGYEVPLDYWRTVDAGWMADQHESGGWGYAAGPPPSERSCTLTMTAAGVATLFITQDYLSAAQGAQCRGNISNPAIERGLRWMGEHFQLPPGQDVSWPYLLYGIERIGVAGGYKYFGTIDWYQRGADFLLERQRPDGSWTHQFDPLVETSFCILFLCRGRAPVIVNKLSYNLSGEGRVREGNWNQRPRDIANLTRWIGRQFERQLNWQNVNLSVMPDDLHDAPILYLSGNQKLELPSEDRDKLKTYIEEGGLIFANADCADSRFADSFRQLGESLFPWYRFRELPPDHPVYRAQFHRDRWKIKPSVLALSNGTRELMVLLPHADPARYWQTQTVGSHEELWQLMANLLLYATDHQNPRTRGEDYMIHPDFDPNTPSNLRRVILLRGRYEGNWDPEPGGWRRFAMLMRNQDYFELKVISADLDKEFPPGAHLLHLTGTERFSLSDAARLRIRQFIDSGGAVIIDAAGGSAEFARAARDELSRILGADEARQLDVPLPSDGRVYHLPQAPPLKVEYRHYARNILGGDLKSPRLRGIQIKGRIAVYFSDEDLSTGLVGQDVGGIIGYTPESADALMRNIILARQAVPNGE